MRLDLLDGEPLVDVADENPLEQVLRILRNEAGNAVLAGQDLLVEQTLAVLVERQVPAEHGVEGDAAAPDIDGYWRVEFAVDYLVRTAVPPVPRSTASHRRSSASPPRCRGCPSRSRLA